MKPRLFALFLFGIAVLAHAGPPSVSVTDARVRLLPGDLPLAGYFVMTSQATEPLRLVGAESPAFGMVMLHQSLEENGVARMVDTDAVDLAPGQSVSFAPGGYHLMLMDGKQTLHLGDQVPITLRFSDAETVAVPFEVVGARAE